MLHCMKTGIFGMIKNRLSRLVPGNQLFCCATKEKRWKIIGFGEVSTEVYDDEPVFRQDTDYIFRFNFNAEQLSTLLASVFQTQYKGSARTDFEITTSRAVQTSKTFDNILGV